MANTNEMKNVVLIIKNGTATGWQNTNYRLQKGELGICYLDSGNVIVKAGVDGSTAWANLPQVEGVFEEDLTLTYAFGKYQPDSTGSFTLNTAGKTMSEVMLDAFAQEVYEGLILTKPTASFAVTGGKSAEVGNTYGNDVVATLTLTPSGTYKYQAKDAEGNKEQADIAFTSANIYQDSVAEGNLKASLTDAVDNKVSYTIDVSDTILADGSVTYTFYGNAAYGADANRPLTNLGNFFKKDSEGNYVATKNFDEAIGQITAGTALSNTKKTVTYTGYRKMFMGTTTNKNPTIDSAFIRGLSAVSEKAAKTTKDIDAAANDAAIYWAWPASLTSAAPTFQYYFMGAWQSLDGPVKLADVDVEGCNGYDSVKYTVYKYSPNAGYFEGAMETRIKIN